MLFKRQVVKDSLMSVQQNIHEIGWASRLGGEEVKFSVHKVQTPRHNMTSLVWRPVAKRRVWCYSGEHQASRAQQKETAEIEALEAQIRALKQDNEDKRAAFNKMMKERSDKFSELEEAVRGYFTCNVTVEAKIVPMVTSTLTDRMSLLTSCLLT